jgi:hypothetical protein
VLARWSANARAARIGPTVCELDGPIPIVKRSRAETYAVTFASLGVMLRKSLAIAVGFVRVRACSFVCRRAAARVSGALSCSSDVHCRRDAGGFPPGCFAM